MTPRSPRILFVTPYEPNSVGNGGNHRAYQIVHDLREAVGDHSVFVLYYYDWFFDWYEDVQKRMAAAESRPPNPGEESRHQTPPESRRQLARLSNAWQRLRDRVQLRTRLRKRITELRDEHQWRTRLRKYAAKRLKLVYPEVRLTPGMVLDTSGMKLPVVEDPLRYNLFQGLYPTKYHSERFSRTEFVAYYSAMIDQIQPDVVVLEDSEMIGLIDYNRQRRLSTIICPQNLESLIMDNTPDEGEVWRVHAHFYDLATEVRLLSRCDRRLFISKVETGFVQGLGFPSQFYPYMPIGSIRKRLLAVYRERSAATATPGLFLLIGSAHYPPIRDGLKWFIRQAAKHGLPPNVRIVCAGTKTDELLPGGVHIPGLELRGWVEQDQLDEFMRTAQCMIVPYQRGFGALTRLSELPLTGVPILASRFATLGVELLPNVTPVDDNWTAWYNAMQSVASGELRIDRPPEPSETPPPSVLTQAVFDLLDERGITTMRGKPAEGMVS